MWILFSTVNIFSTVNTFLHCETMVSLVKRFTVTTTSKQLIFSPTSHGLTSFLVLPHIFSSKFLQSLIFPEKLLPEIFGKIKAYMVHFISVGSSIQFTCIQLYPQRIHPDWNLSYSSQNSFPSKPVSCPVLQLFQQLSARPWQKMEFGTLATFEQIWTWGTCGGSFSPSPESLDVQPSFQLRWSCRCVNLSKVNCGKIISLAFLMQLIGLLSAEEK